MAPAKWFYAASGIQGRLLVALIAFTLSPYGSIQRDPYGTAQLKSSSASTAVLNAAAQNRAPARIVAIGDIHGEFDAFLDILKQAAVVDAGGRWSAGTTTLVQTGDFTDRGPKVRAVMDFLIDLESQARAAGGRVAVLLGNHEVMNLIGDLRDVTPAIFLTFADPQSEKRRDAAYDAYVRWCNEHASAFQQPPKIYQPVSKSDWLAAHPLGYVEYSHAFGPQGRYGRWLRTKQPLLQLGNTVFMHAGINPERAPRHLEDVNRQVTSEIKRWDEYQSRMIARKMALPFFSLNEVLTAAQTEIQIGEALARQGAGSRDAVDSRAIDDRLGLKGLLGFDEWALVNPGGPMWFRGFASWPDGPGTVQMSELLSRYKVAHFVVGHTPQQTARIVPRFDGAVFLIDTGMLASVYSGRASALEIRNGQFTAIYGDGHATIAGSADNQPAVTVR
jgi:hypothetical protein